MAVLKTIAVRNSTLNAYLTSKVSTQKVRKILKDSQKMFIARDMKKISDQIMKSKPMMMMRLSKLK